MPYSKDDLSFEAAALETECTNLRAEALLRAELKASRAETDRLLQGVTITATAEVQKLVDGLRVDLAAARSECDQLKERLRGTDGAMVEALRAVKERDAERAEKVELRLALNFAVECFESRIIGSFFQELPVAPIVYRCLKECRALLCPRCRQGLEGGCTCADPLTTSKKEA